LTYLSFVDVKEPCLLKMMLNLHLFLYFEAFDVAAIKLNNLAYLLLERQKVVFLYIVSIRINARLAVEEERIPLRYQLNQNCYLVKGED